MSSNSNDDLSSMRKVAAIALNDHDSCETENDASSKEWNELDEVAKQGFTANDQRDMQRMGKKQEFRRNFRFLTTVGFTCCVMGTWEILLTSNTQGLLAGGSAGLFWSVCWSYAGQFFVVLSLAEMSSMAPTAGGQYHWVSEFSPPQYQRVLSYFSGWLSTISWQSIVALDCFLVGTIIQGLITVHDDSYVAARWEATLLIVAVSISISLFNIFAAKHLPLAEGIFVTGHFFCFFPIVIILLVLAPKRSAKEVFLEFSDNGAGWPNIGWSTLVGQVSAIFAVLGSDSVVHMAEEVQESSKTVPRAMTWSFLVNIPPTFGLLLTYLFCMPSIEDAVTDPSGYPFIYVFKQATGSKSGTTGLTVVILLLIIMITISAAASTSRQTFAFARDHGLPFSDWLGMVHPRWHVPANSIIFTSVFTIFMSMINIGSTAAFNAILSLSSIALMATYSLSIGCVINARRRKEPLPHARWSLGMFGMPANIAALIYSVWSFFWSFWPNSYHPTAQSMNWACVLFIGLMLMSSILYLTHAKRYEGPVARVQKGV